MLDSILKSFRDEIDIVDKELVSLLSKRLELVKKIGDAKNKTKAPIYRPEREQEIITSLDEFAKQNNLSHINKKSIEAIFYEIFAISRNLEMPHKVAFLGPIGSYTHLAAQNRFGFLSTYLPLKSISSVFSSIECGNARYGVIPLENNTNGIVGESIDLLVKSKLKIINEIVLPIHLSFASTLESLEDIKHIYSKDIAFGQCSDFLSNYNLLECEQICVSSTANAAQLAKQNKNSAAICSTIAAKLYSLPILYENIEKNLQNKTRFIIISDFKNNKSDINKTSIFAKIKDFNKPGALYKLIDDFNKVGINLTKIDSRPFRDGSNFEFGFYIDFIGHIDDLNVQEIFNKRADELTWLGSYPAYK